MSRDRRFATIFVFALAAAACMPLSASWVTAHARKQGAADFGCDVEAVTAQQVEGKEYTHTVQGCGKRANYIRQHCNRGSNFCVFALAGGVMVDEPSTCGCGPNEYCLDIDSSGKHARSCLPMPPCSSGDSRCDCIGAPPSNACGARRLCEQDSLGQLTVRCTND